MSADRRRPQPPAGATGGATPQRKQTLRAWLADRLGLDELGDTIRGGQVPGGASLWHTLRVGRRRPVRAGGGDRRLPGDCYTPSVTDAWASVAYIQDQMTLGWFVRGLHSFGSSALIVVAGAAPAAGPAARRLPAPARAQLDGRAGAVRRGRALFALSGYLLPWDQKGYWAKLVEATITGSAPVVGGAAQRLIQGGAAFGNLTLTHAYAAARDGAAGAADRAAGAPRLSVPAPRLHAEVVAVDRGGGRARRAGLARPGAAQRRRRRCSAWGVVAVAVIARHGAPLESPADPTSSYLARPEWYALPLFQLRMFFEGPLEIVATMIIPGLVHGAGVRAAVPRPRARRTAPSIASAC